MVDSIVKMIVDLLVRPESIAIIVGVVMFLFRMVLKDKSAIVEAIMAKAVDVGHSVLSELAPKTETTVDDKLVVVLKAFKDYFVSHGVTPSPKQMAAAEAMFRAKLMKEAGK